MGEWVGVCVYRVNDNEFTIAPIRYVDYEQAKVISVSPMQVLSKFAIQIIMTIYDTTN